MPSGSSGVGEPGEELQLDWWELAETPWGERAYVLVGALDGVLRRFGGTAQGVVESGIGYLVGSLADAEPLLALPASPFPSG